MTQAASYTMSLLFSQVKSPCPAQHPSVAAQLQAQRGWTTWGRVRVNEKQLLPLLFSPLLSSPLPSYRSKAYPYGVMKLLSSECDFPMTRVTDPQ